MGESGNCSQLGGGWRNGVTAVGDCPTGNVPGTSTASRDKEEENNPGRTVDSAGHV